MYTTSLTFIQPESAELGEILLSLSYLPTAERLTVVVMKAKDLRVPITTPSSGEMFTLLFLLFVTKITCLLLRYKLPTNLINLLLKRFYFITFIKRIRTAY